MMQRLTTIPTALPPAKITFAACEQEADQTGRQYRRVIRGEVPDQEGGESEASGGDGRPKDACKPPRQHREGRRETVKVVGRYTYQITT